MDTSTQLIKKNVTLEKRISQTTPVITADKRKLMQILYNLIGNAAKFTSKGSILIEVKPEAGGQEVSSVVATDVLPIIENHLLKSRLVTSFGLHVACMCLTFLPISDVGSAASRFMIISQFQQQAHRFSSSSSTSDVQPKGHT